MPRPLTLFGVCTTAVGLAMTAVPLVTAAAAAAETCPPPATPTFEMEYIDTARAGGEPLIVTHPDGTLLWGSHAGTTHFYGPAAPDPETAAFLQHYEGQTYQYWSDDDGETWNFSPRLPVTGGAQVAGLPNSGFSDPEFAIDQAGNVFISEINLANIAFSKSTDVGRTWTLQNVIGISLSDRQWMEADAEDVLWFVANTFGGGSPVAGEPVTGSTANRLYKSVDGGVTFSEGQSMGGQQSSEIVLDKRTGTLYQLHEGTLPGPTLSMRVFADAREETPPNVTFTDNLIFDRHNAVSSIGPTPAIDDEGHLYVVWDENGAAVEQGIWYAYSTDGGITWSEAVRIDTGDNFAFWPWVGVNDVGQVALAWLEHEGPIPGNDPEAATAGWHVGVAISKHGLGCAASPTPGFTVVRATDEPVHQGTVCNGGTVCQAQAIDRRLGDYMSVTVSKQGRVVAAVSDTRQGGAVALPLQVRQTGGPWLVGDAFPGADAGADAGAGQDPGGAADDGTGDGGDDDGAPAGDDDPDTPLPTTGGGVAVAALGLALLAGARRRGRTGS